MACEVAIAAEGGAADTDGTVAGERGAFATLAVAAAECDAAGAVGTIAGAALWAKAVVRVLLDARELVVAGTERTTVAIVIAVVGPAASKTVRGVTDGETLVTDLLLVSNVVRGAAACGEVLDVLMGTAAALVVVLELFIGPVLGCAAAARNAAKAFANWLASIA